MAQNFVFVKQKGNQKYLEVVLDNLKTKQISHQKFEDSVNEALKKVSRLSDLKFEWKHAYDCDIIVDLADHEYGILAENIEKIYAEKIIA